VSGKGRSSSGVCRVAPLCGALARGAWLLGRLSGLLRVLWVDGYARLFACSPEPVDVLCADAVSAVVTGTGAANVSLQVPSGHYGRIGEATREFHSTICCPCHSSRVGFLLHLRWRLLR